MQTSLSSTFVLYTAAQGKASKPINKSTWDYERGKIKIITAPRRSGLVSKKIAEISRTNLYTFGARYESVIAQCILAIKIIDHSIYLQVKTKKNKYVRFVQLRKLEVWRAVVDLLSIAAIIMSLSWLCHVPMDKLTAADSMFQATASLFLFACLTFFNFSWSIVII